MEMPNDYLYSLFSRIDSVSSICFTGGEPALAPNVIKEAVSTAKLHGVDIQNFYIATNAKVVPNEFIEAIFSLWQYCSDNECSAVHYSNDVYHDPMLSDNIDKLRAFRFVDAKYPKDGYTDVYLINEGSAADNGIGRRDNPFSGYEIDEGYVSDGEVYLNCKGNIIAGCDFSYESQDDPDRIVCHVKDLTLDKLEEYANE